MNTRAGAIVQLRVTPRSGEEPGYKSRYWPYLNGLADDTASASALWAQTPGLQSERENILLDVIGAYDLLLLQGLTSERAARRLDLHKSRDELVQELDSETARRLAIALPPPPQQPRETRLAP